MYVCMKEGGKNDLLLGDASVPGKCHFQKSYREPRAAGDGVSSCFQRLTDDRDRQMITDTVPHLTDKSLTLTHRHKSTDSSPCARLQALPTLLFRVLLRSLLRSL